MFAALSTATSLAELEAKQAAFQRLPAVSDVQSVLSVLPDRADREAGRCCSAWGTWRTASTRALSGPSICGRSPWRSKP